MNERGELHVYRNASAVAGALAEMFLIVGNAAFADHGRFIVTLAGGTTPRAAYKLLAAPENAQALSWSDVFVYFGDERCVPPDDELSNFRMASQTFLSHVAIPSANIHRMRGEIDPAEAAREYAKELADDLGPNPRFDLVLLGMGADGHTASLFPGSDPTTDSAALARAIYAPSAGTWRITLTPTIFNAAHTVVFATEGYEKANALAAVREGPYLPTTYPAQIIAPTNGRVLWLVDAAAASSLR